MGNCVQFRAKTDVKLPFSSSHRETPSPSGELPAGCSLACHLFLGFQCKSEHWTNLLPFMVFFQKKGVGISVREGVRQKIWHLETSPPPFSWRKFVIGFIHTFHSKGLAFLSSFQPWFCRNWRIWGFFTSVLWGSSDAGHHFPFLPQLTLIESASVNVWCCSGDWSCVPQGLCRACGPLWPCLCQGTAATSLCPYWSIKHFVPYLSCSQEWALQEQRAIGLD